MKVHPQGQEGGVGAIADVKQTSEAAKLFLKKVLEFGPKTPEFTGHIQAGISEFAAAKDMAVAHFSGGVGGQTITITIEDCCEHDVECKQLFERVVNESGLGADGVQGIREWLTFIMQNPALITMIFSWFKTQTPAPSPA